MTALIIAITVLAALLAGVVLCILGVFAWRLLSAVNNLQATAEVMMESIEPLIKEHSPKEIAEDLKALKTLAGKIHEDLRTVAPAMNNLARCVEMFNGTLFDSTNIATRTAPATPSGTGRTPMPVNLPTRFETAEGFAKDENSATFHFDEQEAATREAAEELRKRGIEVQAENITEPTASEMTGAEV